jgi:MarR family transcriptional regulator, organic hydroperoxide resistance regulator
MAAMNPADQGACRAWQLLMKFFFAQRGHLPASGDAFDLSPSQCHVLHLIEPGRPLPMGRLASTLSCDASNVTGLVDRLESRGLVERRPSPRDRRVKVLQLTPAGARLRAQLLRRMTGGSLPLSRLSIAQQRALVKILETLVDENADQSRKTL